MVGMRGFEPRTSCSQSRRAAKLRYIPVATAVYWVLGYLPGSTSPFVEMTDDGTFT